jgi:hypothetical protein
MKPLDTAKEIEARVRSRVKRGLPRDKALMLTIMELGGKITIIKG